MLKDEPSREPQDYSKYRATAVIGYLFPILFFMPLIGEREHKNVYALFHANQQLNLLIFGSAVVIGGFLPFVGPVIIVIGMVMFSVLSILGAVLAFSDKERELPLIGHFRFLE